MKRAVQVALLLFLVFLSPGLYAGQEDSVTVREKKLSIIPFPNIGYAPETDLYFGGVALFKFRLAEEAGIRPSKIKPEINYTLRKQFISTLEFDIYTSENKWYFRGYNAFLNFPDNFWGIGNNMPASNEEIFTAKNLIFKNYVFRSLKGNLYAGLQMHVHSVFDLDTKPSGLLSEGNITGSDGGITSGLGISFLNDERNNIFTPTKGYFIEVSGITYQPMLGSDFEFNAIEVDVRKYFRVFRKRTFAGQPAVLAFQLYNKNITDGAPFNQLALMGSGSHMRGYYTGRYRDNYYMALQGEYRMMVWRFLGFAAFAGVGDVISSYRECDIEGIKTSFGGGLRVRVDKEDNINLRFDYAVGSDGNSGFYVMFGEAF